MEKLEALFRATSSLTTDLDLDALLPRALKILTGLLGCDNAAVLLPVRPGSRVLRIRAAVGYRPEVVESLRLPIGRGVTGWVMETGKMVNIPDVSKDPRYVEGVSGARSEVAVPLVAEGKRIGVLDIESSEKGAFRSRENVQILKIFAGHLASAILAAERYEQIRVQNRNLDVAAQVGRIVASTLNLAEMLDRSMALLRRELDCLHLTVFLLEPDGEHLVVQAISSGAPFTFDVRGERLSIDEGIVGAAVRGKKPVLVADVRKDARYVEGTPGTESELAVPMVFGGEILGVINAESSRRGAFTKAESGLLASVGSLLAPAIRNSLLYSEIFEYSDRMSEAQGFARELNSTLDLREILDIAVTRLPSLVRAGRIALFRYDEEWLILDLVAHNFEGFEGRVQVPATNETDLTRALSVNASLNEAEPERAVRGGTPHPAFPSGPFLSILLKVGERIVGLILLTDRVGGGPFTEQDFHFANTVGEHLAVAIANATLYERTLRLSQTDGLTGLFVHRAFYEALDREIARADETGRPLSLVMGDLDRFKSINDRFGHPFGDRVLAAAARAIRETIRPQDLAARYGGEEFVVLLPETDAVGAFAVAERIRARLEREPFRTPTGPLAVTISFGVAQLDPDRGRGALIEEADRALYRSKREGRNRTTLADDDPA